MVASSYGVPDEVADIYRDTEATVQTALRLPPPKQPRSLPGRLFGVFVDPHADGALFTLQATSDMAPTCRQPARWRAACIQIGRRADQPAFQPPPSFTSTTLSPTLASLPL